MVYGKYQNLVLTSDVLTKQSKEPGKQLMPKDWITKPDVIDLQHWDHRGNGRKGPMEVTQSNLPLGAGSSPIWDQFTFGDMIVINPNLENIQGWMSSQAHLLPCHASHTASPRCTADAKSTTLPHHMHSSTLISAVVNQVERILASTGIGLNTILQNLENPSSSELLFAVPLSLLALSYCSRKAMKPNLQCLSVKSSKRPKCSIRKTSCILEPEFSIRQLMWK